MNTLSHPGRDKRSDRESPLHERCSLQSISLCLPDLQTQLHQRGSKLLQNALDTQLSKARGDGVVIPPLLVSTQRGNLPLPLPLLHSPKRCIVRGSDLGRNHVEGRALGVAALGLEKHNRREGLEVSDQADGVDSLDLVQQDDHGASGPQVLEAQRELGQEEAAGLAVEAVLGALVGAPDRAVAEDEVEVAAVLEVTRVEEAGTIRKLGGDFVRGDAHVGGEHGDVQEVDLDGLGLACDRDKATLRRGQGESHRVGSGVPLEGFGEVGARCHAQVENALGVFGRLYGEGPREALHLLRDVFHQVVQALDRLLAVLIGPTLLPLEEEIALWILPSLEEIVVRNATGP